MLQNAASIAGPTLTTEALVADIKKEEKEGGCCAPPSGGGPGRRGLNEACRPLVRGNVAAAFHAGCGYERWRPEFRGAFFIAGLAKYF